MLGIRPQGFFRGADLLAPSLAGRLARDLWFTVPPTLAAAPLPPGARRSWSSRSAPRFAVTSGARGPVVYFAHGWGGRGSQLTAYVEPLVAAGYRVVLFDAPAHGDSGPGPAGPRRTHGVEFGKALDAVSARFGPAHAVIAHSLGDDLDLPRAALRLARTERLVLLAPMVQAEPLFDQFQQALGFG